MGQSTMASDLDRQACSSWQMGMLARFLGYLKLQRCESLKEACIGSDCLYRATVYAPSPYHSSRASPAPFLFLDHWESLIPYPTSVIPLPSASLLSPPHLSQTKSDPEASAFALQLDAPLVCQLEAEVTEPITCANSHKVDLHPRISI